ncbi:acyl-protein thioesterase 1-like [Styela clava]
MCKFLNVRSLIAQFTVLNIVTGRQSCTSLSQMASSSGECVVNATGKPTGLVIFLHGLGDTGDGWCSLFETIRQKNVKYVFPHAEKMPVSLNMGMRMPSWFDIKSLDMSGEEDEAGITKSAERIRELIKKEQKAYSIPSNRVILGGFSMGGALALYTGLTHKEPLGGLILLSSWLPLREKFSKSQDEFSLVNQTCPIFQGHGEADPIVNIKFGSITHEVLHKARKAAGQSDPPVQFNTYKHLGHSSSDQEMKDVLQFVQKHLSECS